MKRTRINPISKKKQRVLREEAKIEAEMLEKCQGHCMLCHKLPDWRGLERNHTKDRTRFVLSCRSCHSPDGVHKYLDDLLQEVL